MSEIDELLGFWFGELEGPGDYPRDRDELWWSGSVAVDAEIRERFAGLVDRALAGELDHWAETARGRLALIVALDQLTRSLGRGTAAAFAGDRAAQARCLEGIERGHDRELGLVERSFFYMPLMHAEDRALAERSLEMFTELSAEIAERGAEGFADPIGHAIGHADIVRRFGRYPHRNPLLRRSSTPEEKAYLEANQDSFGQRAR